MDYDTGVILTSIFVVQLVTLMYVRWIYLRIEYPQDRQFERKPYE